ncbi:vWA domain-containing protein [Nonomuraea sp. NPDC050786]|uniref:vWA domain-containing protein n=1 Tax=Nonomuraea sp. NPDC050786 TaxID=3154840 RepID=UPI0033BFDD16
MTSITPTERWRHIELVLDRSSSMHPIKAQTEAGVRAFLAEQRQVGGRTTVSLTLFNHSVELQLANCDLGQVPEITLEPRGRTALLDAIGETIARARRFVRGRSRAERPDEIIVVILTDGHENASVSFTHDMVREMIAEQRSKKRSWQFVLLGADEAVHALARILGIDADAAIQYDHDLSEGVLSAAGRMIRRGTESGRYGFTDQERRVTRHPSL